MASGSFSATAVDSVVIAKALMANASLVEIQRYAGGAASDVGHLGFGGVGVDGEGVKLSSGTPYYKIVSGDPRLLQDVHIICPAGETITGGYEIS